MKLNTVESMEDFLASKGLDKEAFRAARSSFGVQTKVNRAMDLSKRFDITGVPNVVVDGTYKTLNSKDQQEMIDLVAFLVEKSRAKKQ
jgi:thiol:disulfide interchange protein DsbA